MRLLIISDSHGNITNLKHVMGFGRRFKVGAVVHCGDWDNATVAECVLSFGIPLYSVLGNADIDPKIEESLSELSKKFDRVFLEFELGGRKIGVIHNIRDLEAGRRNLDIIFFGHWQKQRDISWKGTRVINPGSLENEINFAVYDTDTDKVEFIHD